MTSQDLTSMQLPAPLAEKLLEFAKANPEWDLSRMATAAIAMFLMQQGVCDRAVNRCYLDALFGKGGAV